MKFVESHRWTAILLAGQRPGPDPLAKHFGQEYKALIPVCGKSMLQRVVETLLQVRAIGRIIVLAQEPDGLIADLPEQQGSAEARRITSFVSNAGIAESISAVLESGNSPWPVLITTADHPLLTPAIVDEFLSGAADGDLTVGVVERTIVLGSYPDTRRTWLKFADGAYSGANLFALRSDKVERALNLWRRAERDRKQAVKLFWHFGPWLALLALFRMISFADALARAGRRLGLDAHLVALSFAEAAIDVDKVSDHELVERIIRSRKRVSVVTSAIESDAQDATLAK